MNEKVHCTEAEQANAEPRLDCAYRRWWETSGWLLLLQRFTGNSWTMVAAVCTTIVSLAWLASVLCARSPAARGGGGAGMGMPWPTLMMPDYAAAAAWQQQQPPWYQQVHAQLPPPAPPAGGREGGRGRKRTKLIYLRAREPDAYASGNNGDDYADASDGDNDNYQDYPLYE